MSKSRKKKNKKKKVIFNVAQKLELIKKLVET